jgi:Fe-S-cluster containining protein
METIELAGDRMRITEDEHGTATVVFDAVGTGRSCGNCTLCCKLLPVPVPQIAKPANQRCQHQRFKGCSIYAQRPMACRTWSCRWMADADTTGMPRPDRCHYVIDITYDKVIRMNTTTGERSVLAAMQVWIDPAFRDAHRAPELRRFVEHMGKKWGVATIVRWGSAKGLILFPPSLTGGHGWIEDYTDQVPAAEAEALAADAKPGIDNDAR